MVARHVPCLGMMKGMQRFDPQAAAMEQCASHAIQPMREKKRRGGGGCEMKERTS